VRYFGAGGGGRRGTARLRATESTGRRGSCRTLAIGGLLALRRRRQHGLALIVSETGQFRRSSQQEG
jgi:hypothetical protein